MIGLRKEISQRIVIPIAESDVDKFKDLVFSNEDGFTWAFESDKGELIEVRFERDYEDEESLSECCGAEIIDDTDFCSECREHV